MADREPRALPVPGEPLHLRYIDIEPGTIYHRFHMDKYPATAFNGSSNGNARFSPIRNAAGDIIPTIYGAQTLHCAAMETIFRDLAYLPPGDRHIKLSKYAGLLHSLVKIEEPLNLVDLTSKSLTALGMTRRDLIDTDGSRYTYTQHWAQAIHAYAPDVQGLSWISRQDDTAQAIILFGDRVDASALSLASQSLPILFSEPTYSSLLDLLDILDVDIEI